MKIDQDVIEAKLDIIERNLAFLDEFKGMDYEEFCGSYKNVQSAKYSLLELIECCIGMASHIIAVRGMGRAEEYREMFYLLGERGVIEKALAERLGDMAGFRNLLVHRYGDVDNTIVLEMIGSELEDVVEFERAVVQFMEYEAGR
ncbi:MAG: DUF86 domain-containing protein [Methanosarcinales archaeon]|uniref:DUF86 domain-containing protein n=1 Tax=Candidatus Ethanoperedens thermophilum TaxID=2766897 RepID=A0A848D2Q0_9EURY|nr:DUF86 domain-containing protein [Candidatus Ethanoperedens thermophilum]